ncbi:MAG: hypothetical protein ACE147_11595 [Candidatus Methylomirabilales bacterium]
MSADPSVQREWLRQWRNAGAALAANRREELARLTEDRALAASEALLALVTTVGLSPKRLHWSGLVEQQALFHPTPAP